MPISEFAARKAKPREKAYKLPDGGGLYLHVQPSGSKLWRMKYRYLGKEKLLSFGPYPLISIAKARRKRDDAKRLLLEDIDPSAQKKQKRLDAELKAKQTFGLVADDYLQQQRDRGAAEATQTKTAWLLKDLASSICDRPIAEITPAELLVLLQRIERNILRSTRLENDTSLTLSSSHMTMGL